MIGRGVRPKSGKRAFVGKGGGQHLSRAAARLGEYRDWALGEVFLAKSGPIAEQSEPFAGIAD
jgi:hypothetical protein